jgi:hypothetical protein
MSYNSGHTNHPGSFLSRDLFRDRSVAPLLPTEATRLARFEHHDPGAREDISLSSAYLEIAAIPILLGNGSALLVYADLFPFRLASTYISEGECRPSSPRLFGLTRLCR